MLEQQYDYYRQTNNSIILYSLGIVVAFAITLSAQHADGKFILNNGWQNNQRDVLLVLLYISIFIVSWAFYFIALRKMDDEMRIIREHCLQTGTLKAQDVELLERSKKWELRVGVFLLACFVLAAVLIDTKPSPTLATTSSTLICRTP